MKNLTFLHDKTRQNQGERIEYAKFSSSILPMSGGREPNVSRVSAKKKIEGRFSGKQQ